MYFRDDTLANILYFIYLIGLMISAGFKNSKAENVARGLC